MTLCLSICRAEPLPSDDLDFSASQRSSARASEHASTAVKSPALNVAIGVSAVVMVVGLGAVGYAAVGRHGADRHAQPRLLGPLHHRLHVLRGPVGRRSHHLARCPRRSASAGFGGISQGGGVLVHRLHGGRHRSCGGGYGPALPRVGAVRVFQLWAARSCGISLFFPRTSSCRACTCGPRFRPSAARSARWPCASSAVIALVCRRARPLGDRLDLRASAGPRDVAHGASGPLVRVLGALVCGTALVMAVVIGLRRAGYLNLEQDEHRAVLPSCSAPSCWWTCTSSAATCLPKAFPGGAGARGSGTCSSQARLPRTSGWRSSAVSLCAVVCLTPALRHKRASGGGVAAGHRRHLLQARAAAGGRIPNH